MWHSAEAAPDAFVLLLIGELKKTPEVNGVSVQ